MSRVITSTHLALPDSEEEEEVEQSHDKLEEGTQPHVPGAQVVHYLPQLINNNFISNANDELIMNKN